MKDQRDLPRRENIPADDPYHTQEGLLKGITSTDYGPHKTGDQPKTIEVEVYTKVPGHREVLHSRTHIPADALPFSTTDIEAMVMRAFENAMTGIYDGVIKENVRLHENIREMMVVLINDKRLPPDVTIDIHGKMMDIALGDFKAKKKGRSG